jgi:hypothetical protein
MQPDVIEGSCRGYDSLVLPKEIHPSLTTVTCKTRPGRTVFVVPTAGATVPRQLHCSRYRIHRVPRRFEEQGCSRRRHSQGSWAILRQDDWSRGVDQQKLPGNCAKLSETPKNPVFRDSNYVRAHQLSNFWLSLRGKNEESRWRYFGTSLGFWGFWGKKCGIWIGYLRKKAPK